MSDKTLRVPDEAVKNLLGKAGLFLVVAERIIEGTESLAAALSREASRATFFKARDAVQEFIPTDDPLVVLPAGPRGLAQSTRPRVTEVGLGAVELLRGLVEKLGRKEAPPPAPFRLVIQEGSMLLEVAEGRLRIDHPEIEVESLPLADIPGAFDRGANRPDAALIWMAGGKNPFKKDLHAEPVGGSVRLGVLCRSPARLAKLRAAGGRTRHADLGRVGAGQSVAYPGWLAAVGGMLPRGAEKAPEDTLAEVVLAVLAGKATFGVVPQMPDATDGYRSAGQLDYLPLARSATDPTAVALAFVRPPGAQHRRCGAVRDSLERIAGRLDDGSPLDNPAHNRRFPVAPSAYESVRYGYYLETLTEGVPVWRAEVVRLKVAAPAGDGATPAGARTFRLEGKAVNANRSSFAVFGALIGDYALHLEFNSLTAAAPSDKNPPVTFLALFPYFHLYRGQSVFQGVWFGRDANDIPLVNAMILSSGPLTHADLDAITHLAQLRYVPFGAAAELDLPDGLDAESQEV